MAEATVDRLLAEQRRYYRERAPEYDDWWLGTGRFEERARPGWAEAVGVLEALLAAGGAVVSAEELLERAWDEHADPFTNAVRVMMVKLRRKLGNPPLIETVPGAGYRIP